MDGFNGGERVCANLCNSLSGGADIFLDLHRNALHLPILYWTHTAK